MPVYLFGGRFTGFTATVNSPGVVPAAGVTLNQAAAFASTLAVYGSAVEELLICTFWVAGTVPPIWKLKSCGAAPISSRGLLLIVRFTGMVWVGVAVPGAVTVMVPWYTPCCKPEGRTYTFRKSLWLGLAVPDTRSMSSHGTELFEFA